jgi:hypothetical protein
MKEFNVIPSYFKVLFTTEDIKSIKHEWKKPKGYHLGIYFSNSYSNCLHSIIKDMAKYFNLKNKEIKSTLTNFDKVEDFLNHHKLLTNDTFFYQTEYGTTSVLFKEKNVANSFVKKLNQVLESEYTELEDQIKVRLLLSSVDVRDYEKSNIIFTSRDLAEHFITTFGVKYFFRTLEIVDILKEGVLGMEAKVKFYTEVCGQCHLCGKPLTDEYSQQSGIGPVCAKKKLGIQRTNTDNIEETIQRIKEVAEEMGIVTVFIPKNQIKKINKSAK